MKKIILCLVITLSFTAVTSLFAQNPTGGQMQQKMRQYLKDTLNLSDALTDSVIAVHREYMPQIRQVLTDQSLGITDKETKMQDFKAQMETRYKAIGLTDDQIKMIEERDKRMREQMRNRMNSGGGQPQQ
jgi:hypothetical protein